MRTTSETNTLTNEAQAPQSEIEDHKGEDRQPNPVLDNAASTENAHTRRKGPAHKQQVDRDPGDPVQRESGEHGGQDEREEGVSDDTDTLGERAICRHKFVSITPLTNLTRQ